MRIRMLKQLADLRPGDELEVGKTLTVAIADRWIADGRAEPVKPQARHKAVLAPRAS